MDSMVSEGIVSVTDKMLEYVDGITGESFAQVGIGIASVLILILCFYFIASMMNGGRFQLKMLIPMLVFLLVCNFSWIAAPVTGFTRTVTRSLCEACVNSKLDVMHEYGGEDCNDIMTLFWCLKDAKKSSARMETEQKATEDMSGKAEARPQDGDSPADAADTEDSKWYSRLFNSVTDALEKKGTDMKVSIVENSMLSRKSPGAIPVSHITLSGVIAYILSFVASVISYCLQAMGIMMTSLIVAFGPITFAFALLPGRASSVMTWFIRICQFALYAPLSALIDCFTIKIMCLFYDPTVDVGFLLLFAVLVCNLVCLTSVPTIASMIIEGASGAVSLSGGIQAMASALTKSSATMAAGGMLLAGRNGSVAETISGVKGEGLVNFGKDAALNGMGSALENARTFGGNVKK